MFARVVLLYSGLLWSQYHSEAVARFLFLSTKVCKCRRYITLLEVSNGCINLSLEAFIEYKGNFGGQHSPSWRCKNRKEGRGALLKFSSSRFNFHPIYLLH